MSKSSVKLTKKNLSTYGTGDSAEEAVEREGMEDIMEIVFLTLQG